ncbi:MAG: guanylate kinase [Synergistaceae bacterium]|jgi:guanylate kinase|nr:guanylate kinase [Synergistaceae bacterium]
MCASARGDGILFIISGPAGVGKGTLRKALFEEFPDLVYSISCTTRPFRKGEEEGVDYCFMSEERFFALVDEGAFLEWAEVHGNLYGTKRTDVEECLVRGDDMVLEIDVKGSLNVKRQIPEAVRIFITVSSPEVLYERLEVRGTETAEQMRLRLKNAGDEISCSREFEHVIVNDCLDVAAQELLDLVRYYRSKKRPREET